MSDLRQLLMTPLIPLPGTGMKRCNACRRDKPLADFALARSKRDGRFHRCRLCHHDYYLRNKPEILTRQAKYVAQNRDAVRARQRAWDNRQPRHPRTPNCVGLDLGWLRILGRDRYRRIYHTLMDERRRDANRARLRRLYLAARPAFLERARFYKQQYPDRIAEYRHRRSAKIRGAGGMVPAKAWHEILNYFGHRCAYCGGHADTQDHLDAISRGGRHVPENVVPACRSCNSRKQDALLFIAVQRGVGLFYPEGVA